jgi:putative SOS response-associated peptidase YedK
MCSHYAYRRKELNRLADLANFERLGREIADRYNISPTQTTIVLRQDAEGAAELVPMRWGLVPAWSEALPKVPLINAKAETAHKLPSFRSAFKARRCVLPATAYYEFPGTRAFAIRPTDEEPILFAGLWEEWRGGDAPLLSCTMLTCEPNERRGGSVFTLENGSVFRAC